MNVNGKIDQRALRTDLLRRLRALEVDEELAGGVTVCALVVKNSSYAIVPVTSLVNDLASAVGYDVRRALSIRLAVEEMLTGRILDAYSAAGDIRVRITLMPEWLRVSFSDSGAEYEANGIRTDREAASDAETFEPLSVPYEVSPDFRMPERREQPKPYHLPDIVANRGGEVREYGFSIPSDAFMGFVKANGTSPAVALSMLMGEAVQKRHPDADTPIISNVPISVRRMLGCEETFKNCSSRAVLPLTGTPMDALPFPARAAALRGVLKQQMVPDLYRAVYNRLGRTYRQRMQEGTDYWEEVRKPAGFMTLSHDTFYADYIGRLHETDYSDQLTDVRFLCTPPAGNTLRINMIEHHRRFRIDCLACSDVTPLMDALEEALKNHALPAQWIEEQRFTLALTAWREGL